MNLPITKYFIFITSKDFILLHLNIIKSKSINDITDFMIQ